MPSTQILLQLLAALAAGLLIGIERGWKLRSAQEGTRVAGVRTFTLFGILAGIAGLLAQTGYPMASALLVGGTALVVAIGYARSISASDLVDATSAIAAFR